MSETFRFRVREQLNGKREMVREVREVRRSPTSVRLRSCGLPLNPFLLDLELFVLHCGHDCTTFYSTNSLLFGNGFKITFRVTKAKVWSRSSIKEFTQVIFLFFCSSRVVKVVEVARRAGERERERQNLQLTVSPEVMLPSCNSKNSIKPWITLI